MRPSPFGADVQGFKDEADVEGKLIPGVPQRDPLVLLDLEELAQKLYALA